MPLSNTAQTLILKYKGIDKKGRLFPFISAQKYNDAIKEIFTKAGITRDVIIRNARTGENEIRSINEIASSHLARRTFVGNAYKEVSDPNIISEMSGHVEGSKAFARYRNIETDILKNVISKIDRTETNTQSASEINSLMTQLASLNPNQLAVLKALINQR